MGRDGLTTLFLTLLVTAATASVSLLVCWVLVIRTARATGTRPSRADLVVVFGVRLDKAGNPVSEYRSRLRRALRLGSELPLMILGGGTGRDTISEAAAGRLWLAENGWRGNLVTLEDRSRNTLENLRHAREAMRIHGYILPALVTSRHHLARSSAMAAGLGIAHELCAAEERHGIGPRNFAKSFFEAVLLNWYYVGKYWASLTRNPRLLERIT